MKDIYTYCLDLLSRRAYSTFKLRRKLKQKKYPENEMEVVLKLLTAEKYLRDDLYAEARARTWIAKKYSAFQIKRKLQIEGLALSGEKMKEVFEESHQSEEDQVRELIEKQFKKLRTLPTDRREIFRLKQKITAAVRQKGHNFSLIKAELDRRL